MHFDSTSQQTALSRYNISLQRLNTCFDCPDLFFRVLSPHVTSDRIHWADKSGDPGVSHCMQSHVLAQHFMRTTVRDNPSLSRQRSPLKRSRVRDATQIHLLAETSVLPLAQWSSMSNKCNSTSFPTSVHIFRSCGGLRLCSYKWKTSEGSPSLWLASVCPYPCLCSRVCVSECVWSAWLYVFSPSACLGCNLNRWRLWAG